MVSTAERKTLKGKNACFPCLVPMIGQMITLTLTGKLNQTINLTAFHLEFICSSLKLTGVSRNRVVWLCFQNLQHVREAYFEPTFMMPKERLMIEESGAVNLE